ncbi:hypothetical protein R1flu_006995 [Riccia fluitans]|uniref:Uncharacterized protein n=1 Tax=Riccia fluitans TaxID=41844 RepID=A0ABD1YXM1_9MARC
MTKSFISAARSATRILSTCLAVLWVSFSSADAAYGLDLSLRDIGLLVNFSVPCDLHSDIAVPDGGGLLTPNLLAVGYQRYMYNGSAWQFSGQHATLYNKTLAKVGRLYGGKNRKVTFELFAGQTELATTSKAQVQALPIKSVYQMFSIPLQLLSVSQTSEISNYAAADYIQRFATQNGLPPGGDFKARKATFFNSRFSALYAFYLPFDKSPQLATRVPRCGDERFYGLQFGRSPGF